MAGSRFDLIARGAEEIVTEEELAALLDRKERIRSYVGFEPSGLMHIGQGFVIARKVIDFSEAGLDTIILLADWHAYINDKLDGNLENIKICGDYVRDCFIALGVDPQKTEFLFAHELVGRREYWQKVLSISKNATVSRMRRAMTIMGRKEEDADVDASKLIYPAMQAADIVELDLDIALGGMDQRHAHMLLRDVAEKIGARKPIAVHTPLLAGLQGGGRMDSFEGKMSKSKLETFISIHEKPDAVEQKIRKAYCPEGDVQDNPVLDICGLIIFPEIEEFKVEREEKFGGDVVFTSFGELSRAFGGRELHPSDLKNATTRYLNEILKPVRAYFEKNPDNYERMLELMS
ncbi:MAG: tyrosine--tRNA ligase [Thermoplasmata archaeon]|nr:tyrosine--tRNA ligase [Thermoplasmata archaeon]